MPEPTRWRKKPVEVEAMHYPAEPTVHDNAALHRWINDNGGRTEVVRVAGQYAIAIRTLEGDMIASPGDYVIRGVQGEFYPCKPDIFADTYEPAEETVLVKNFAGQVVHEHPVPAEPDDDEPEYPETLAVAQLIYEHLDSEGDTEPPPWDDLDEEQRAPFILNARNLAHVFPDEYPKLAAELAEYRRAGWLANAGAAWDAAHGAKPEAGHA